MFVAAVYLPDLGRGFIRDDFRWIRDGRAMLAEPWRPFAPLAPDFYRPLVTASFAIDYRLHGPNALGYGLTNLALLAAAAVVIWRLCRALSTSGAAAVIAVLAWVANPHGINMALLWISGRTSLLLTLFAAASALAYIRGRRTTGAALLLGALLAKEEAVVLPLVLTIALRAIGRGRRALALDALSMAAPLAVYFGLRLRSPALTPATAPDYYRLTFDLGTLISNGLQYLDRAATIFVVFGLAAWLIYRPRRVAVPRATLVTAITWFAGGFALTVWVPVRSTLYAVFPSVGAAILCAALVDAFRASSRDLPRRDVRFAAVAAVVLLAVPVYRSRNVRWTAPARLSAEAVRALLSAPPPPRAAVVVFDDEEGAGGATFRDAFGSSVNEAVVEVTGRSLEGRLASRSAPWTGPAAARYIVRNGRVQRAP